jgi:hypothetical protein
MGRHVCFYYSSKNLQIKLGQFLTYIDLWQLIRTGINGLTMKKLVKSSKSAKVKL